MMREEEEGRSILEIARKREIVSRPSPGDGQGSGKARLSDCRPWRSQAVKASVTGNAPSEKKAPAEEHMHECWNLQHTDRTRSACAERTRSGR